MIRKLLAATFISFLIAGGVFAQQTERRIGRMILSEPFVVSYLGVRAVEVTRENFTKYNLREVRGVAVESVVKDSPAERAGIQKGDVIVRFAGEEVSSVYKLTRLLSEIAPDHTAKITLLRGGAETELTATLGKRESAQFADSFLFPGAPPQGTVIVPRLLPTLPNGAQIFPVPPMTGDDGNVFIFPRGAAASRQIGINVYSLTAQLADYFGVAGENGLLISSVRENSPAARAGLKAGDIITEADGKAVKNNLDLIRALGEKAEGDVTLTVVRDRNRQTLKVTPEAAKGDVNQQQKTLKQMLPDAPNKK